jgi:hypothetical protein
MEVPKVGPGHSARSGSTPAVAFLALPTRLGPWALPGPLELRTAQTVGGGEGPEDAPRL